MSVSRTVFLFAVVVAVLILNTALGHQGDETKRKGWRDDQKCGDNVMWVLLNETLIINGTGQMLDDCPSSYIDEDDVETIITIIIEGGVTSIGNDAFSGFSNLTNVTLPSTLTSIGKGAFQGCRSLIQFSIPESVTQIQPDAFYNCGGLKEITIPAGIVSIGTGAFDSCTNLTNITVLGNNRVYKSISGVLYSRKGDELIRVPQGLSGVFTVPDHVTIIGDGAFWGCSFSTITIPGTVTSIRDRAFFGCTILSSIMLPDTITSIGKSAFGNCLSLINITIPKDVKSISSSTFIGCSKLSSISVPDSVTSIGSHAFSSCEALASIHIPESVTSIGMNAFWGCKRLCHITIPENIKKIEQYTFSGCECLNSVTIPNKVMSIGDHAFSSCYNLEQITIPDSVTSIGDEAFSSSAMINVTIPSSVSSIGGLAFCDCSKLVTVFYLGSYYISSSLFRSRVNLANVCVSPDYNYTQFGGVNVTSSHETCREFRSMFNHCFKPSYVDGVFVQEMDSSAKEWEDQTNDCMEYRCINDIGLVAWSMCNSTDDTNYICILNKECVSSKESVDNKNAYVEIQIEDGVSVVDMNTEQILETLNNHCGVDINEMTIAYENDKYGNLLRVFVYVNDEETAKIVADGVREIKQVC